jgi:YVTN family beta-propeller protein
MRQDGKRILGRLGAALLIASTAMLTGCSDFFKAITTTSTGSSSYVYVTNAGGTLAEYTLTSGVLAAVSGSPISLPEAPTCIAVAPNNAFLYVGTAEGVFLYTIGSGGALTEGNDDTVVYINQSGLQVESMVIDSTSSWLIMTYQNSTEIDALPISATSGLAGTTVYSATLKAGTTSPTLAITPANSTIMVTMGSTGTEVIAFNPSATGTPFATTATVIAPNASAYSATAVASDPSSTYLYITEASTATTPGVGKLRLFKLASLGAELSGSPYTTGIGPSAVLPDKSGAYVYVANSTDGTLSGYTIDTTAQTLTALDSTIPTGKSPVGLAEDTSKKYVLSAGSGANPNLWLYSFDTAADGSLDVASTTSTLSTSPSAANGIAVTY